MTKAEVVEAEVIRRRAARYRKSRNPSVRTLEEAIADATSDPAVDWLDLTFTWRRKDILGGSWQADMGGVDDGEAWESHPHLSSDPAEALDLARLTEREDD